MAADTAVLTVYTTTWCGYCLRLKRLLDREGIRYVEVDIEQDPGAAEYVSGVNGGNRTVPTVRLPGGGALTNPTVAEVKQGLAETV